MSSNENTTGVNVINLVDIIKGLPSHGVTHSYLKERYGLTSTEITKAIKDNDELAFISGRVRLANSKHERKVRKIIKANGTTIEVFC